MTTDSVANDNWTTQSKKFIIGFRKPISHEIEEAFIA